MSRRIRLFIRIILFALFYLTDLVIIDGSYAADFSAIQKTLGMPGQEEEGAFVFRAPRSDLKVKINGESVPTALGFGLWTAWKEMGNDFMVMGDLVLLENEINPVISALAEADISISALHNHFLGEEPRIMYMHIHGMGPAQGLARGIRNALDKTAIPKTAEKSASSESGLNLDTMLIEAIIDHPGKGGGGVFKITVGRPGVKMKGVDLTASMGLNTWAAFCGTNERAHVAGDVAMTAREVNPVIRALRRGGIDVVAVHNHMLDEDPRIFFLHYWGTGPAEKLAQTIREAFDQAKGPVR